MKSLRILLVMPDPPLPFGSAAARWYYALLKGLVQRGHRVTAFAACPEPSEIRLAKELFPPSDYDLRCYSFPNRNGIKAKIETLRQPYSYMFGPDLRRDLCQELTGRVDILHLEQLWTGWLGLESLERTLVNVHYLYWIDLDDFSNLNLRSRVDRQIMFWAERRLVRTLKNFRSLSDRLTAEIVATNPTAYVRTGPIGLDLDRYHFIPESKRPTEDVISMIGSMNWYPSRSAAFRLLDRLWPAIKAQVPGARLQIIGWNARAVLRNYLERPDVVIEENVRDIHPYFENTSVLVYAPGRGSGMKVKVLESFAFGVPVVTTSEGVEGLPAVDGVHAGIAEDDAGLIERTITLLKNPDLQRQQRCRGRKLVEERCGSEVTLNGVESIYSDMLNLPKGAKEALQ